MGKIVEKDSIHLRWNFEISPDSNNPVSNSSQLRYYFIIVGDSKTRRNKLTQILERFQSVSPGIKIVDSHEGDVKNSKFKYSFNIYDSPLAPDVLSLYRIFSKIVRDKELYERKHLKVEDYVARLYGN